MKMFLRTDLFICICVVIFCTTGWSQTNYYVSTSGSDANNGTSPDTPWQTLAKISATSFQPGDSVLFKRGDEFIGHLVPKSSGTEGSPITFAAYGASSKKPIINGSGEEGGDYGEAILIKNQDNLHFNHLEITNDRKVSRKNVPDEVSFGIFLINSDSVTKRNFDFSYLTIRDVLPAVVTDFKSITSAGINISNRGKNYPKNIRDVRVDSCYMTMTGRYGIWANSSGTNNESFPDSLQRNMNFVFTNNHFYKTGGSAIQPSSTYNCLMEGNVIDWPGDATDPRMAGRGSGLWFTNCRNVVAQHNISRHANGWGDSYSMHIDFKNKYVIYQYNYSEDAIGGFLEILGANDQVCYRFNISVNDGYRDNANTLWFSPYAGKDNNVNSENIYVYNNSTFIDRNTLGDNLTPGINLRCGSAFVYNNIFYTTANGSIGTDLYTYDGDIDTDNNLFYGTVLQAFKDEDGHKVEGDCNYQNPGVFDADGYRLNQGSPGLAAGRAIVDEVDFPMAGKGIFAHVTANASVDFFGNPVDLSQPGTNIGAYNCSGEIPLGISGLTSEPSDVQVFPNSLGQGQDIHILVNPAIAGQAVYSLYQMSGKMIQIPTLMQSAETMVPTRELPRGTYLLCIEIGNRRVTKRLLIE